MSIKINSFDLPVKENEIVDFISGNSIKDRSILIEYISKLSNAGLYIPNIKSLLNFCDEAIILNDKELDDVDEELIPKWYWADDEPYVKGVKPTYKPCWKQYALNTCKRLELARKHNILTVAISNTYYCNINSMFQVRINDDNRKRLIRRDEPKKKEEIITTTTTTTTTDGEASSSTDTATTIPTTTETTDSNILEKVDEIKEEKQEEEIDIDEPFVQWYWADDGPKGHQDEWKEYPADLCRRLEKEHQSKENKPIKVDEQRFVDTGRMLQVRYDSRYRVRMVKREIKDNTPPLKSPGKIQKLYNLMSNFTISSPAKNQPPPLKVNVKTVSKVNGDVVDTKTAASTKFKGITNELLNVLNPDQVNYLLKKLTFAIPPSAPLISPASLYQLKILKETISKNNNTIKFQGRKK